MPTPTDPKLRFSDRVADYVRYRPHYPNSVIDTLETHCGLTQKSVVADLGSGTGIFTKLLLDAAGKVYGIEPNQEMRIAGEEYLEGQSHFTSINATAEASTLATHSLDLITVAQAFHWFDVVACKKEFIRILKPKGYLALIWNERLITGSDFALAYEQLLNDFATDYKEVRHERVKTKINDFFAPAKHQLTELPNAQHLNYEQLAGRLLSSSYAPNKDQPGHDAMMHKLTEVFSAHAVNNKITMDYSTQIYFGQLQA